MDLKTIQLQDEDFYSDQLGVKYETIKSQNPKSKFEIKLCFGKNFTDNINKQVLRTVAQTLCNCILSEAIHDVHIVSSTKNQTSVVLGLLPSWEVFRNVYNPKTDSQEAVIKNNLPTEAQNTCTFVTFLTMTQLQAFGYNVDQKQTINCVIGLEQEFNYQDVFQMMYQTLGRLKGFRKDSFDYVSLPSYCSFSAEGINSDPNQTPKSYLSVDLGKERLGPFYLKNNHSFEFDTENDTFYWDLQFLDVLGFTISPMEYFSSKNVFAINNNTALTVTNNFSLYENNGLTFKISPHLPKGLFFDSKTGQISGKATELSENTMYLVTAFDSETQKKLFFTLVELEVQDGKTKQENPSTVNAFYTAFVILFIFLIVFAIVALGYRAFK